MKFIFKLQLINLFFMIFKQNSPKFHGLLPGKLLKLNTAYIIGPNPWVCVCES